MPELSRLSDIDEGLTAALGRGLAAVAQPGQVYLLEGPLGAGKTHFARAFIRARLRQPDAEVPSPSFTLVQTYDDPAGAEIWHADLYRLGDATEVAELGLEDASPEDIRLIEWPDRLHTPPEDALIVAFSEGTTPDRRTVTLSTATGVAAPDDWSGISRAVARTGFLAASGMGEAMLQPLAGDASSRRYFRVTDGARTAILMDDAPGNLGPYLTMTDWLRNRGFHAPTVYAADTEAGFALLEDLGDDLLARVLADDPGLAAEAYLRLADLLAALHRHPPAPGLSALDGKALAFQADVFADWYGPAVGAPEGLGPTIAATLYELHERLCADTPPVTGLRDFHAENIVWMGDAPPGLLDFQDAVAVHPAYDLVSVLQDVRRDVAETVEHATLDHYITVTGQDPASFRAAYALLGAARNLRILGIFARLCLRDGKPRYLDFMPRAWALLQRDLGHPALASLAGALAPMPPPDPGVIEEMRTRCGTVTRTP